MASPQLEHGFTRIAHELLDAIARAPLSGLETRIVLAVLRRTYGARGSPKVAGISLGELAMAVGASKGRLSRVVADLFRARVLREETREQGWHAARLIGINKCHVEWLFLESVGCASETTVVAPTQPLGCPSGNPPRCPSGNHWVAPVATTSALQPKREAGFRAPETTTDTTTDTTTHASLRAAVSKPVEAPATFELAPDPAPAARKPAPDPRVKLLVDRFVAAFSAEFGRSPVLTGHAALAKRAKDLLRGMDLAGEADALGALDGLLPAYFELARRDRFYAGAPLGKFLDGATIERLRAGPTARPETPAERRRRERQAAMDAVFGAVSAPAPGGQP